MRDIEVNSLEVVSFTTKGLRDIDAVLRVNVHNPSADVEITDMSGVLKLRGTDMMTLKAEPLKIHGNSDEPYLLTVHGSIDDGFNPFRLLGFFTGNVEDRLASDDFSLDLKLRPVLNSGIGKNIEINDIHINDLLTKQ